MIKKSVCDVEAHGTNVKSVCDLEIPSLSLDTGKRKLGTLIPIEI